MRTVSLLLALSLGAAGAVQGQSAVTGSIAGASAYVFRGQFVNDRPVVQPTLGASTGAWTFSVWGNADLTDRNLSAGEFTEVDLTVSWAGARGPLSFGAGYIEYLFPNTTLPGTREVWAKAALASVPLAPSVSVFWDLKQAKGAYAQLGIGHTVPVSPRVSVALSGTAAWADANYTGYYFGVAKSAWNDASAGLAVNVKVNPTLTLTPSVSYSWLWDRDVRSGAESVYHGANQVWTGLAFGYSF